MKIIESIAGVATALGAISPVTAAVGVAMTGVIGIIDAVKEEIDLEDDEVRELEKTREQLERDVNAHADRTINSLGDDL